MFHRKILASLTTAAFLALSLSMVVAAPLTGCSLVGVPTPVTFNQRVASVQASVTAVRETATELVNNGSITADDAQNIQEQANTAREGIDLAIKFYATDPEQADNRLQAAQIIVDALKAYLQRQVKK